MLGSIEIHLRKIVYFLWEKRCRWPRAWPKIGRFLGRFLALSEPFSTQMDKQIGF
jgi:hypothetical protein